MDGQAAGRSRLPIRLNTSDPIPAKSLAVAVFLYIFFILFNRETSLSTGAGAACGGAKTSLYKFNTVFFYWGPSGQISAQK